MARQFVSFTETRKKEDSEAEGWGLPSTGQEGVRPCDPVPLLALLGVSVRMFKEAYRPQKHWSVKWKAEVNWKSIVQEGRSAVCQEASLAGWSQPWGWGLLLSWDSPSPARTLGAVGEGTATTWCPDSVLQNQESWSTKASPKENSSGELVPWRVCNVLIKTKYVCTYVWIPKLFMTVDTNIFSWFCN